VSPTRAALLLGMLQGWLPCALVYAAASRACVAGSAAKGALTMLVFGLGTVPSIFMLSVMPLSFLKRAGTRRPAGALLIVLGVLLTLRGLAGFGLLQPTYLW
jgi:sulfite exporter TauE/SafE